MWWGKCMGNSFLLIRTLYFFTKILIHTVDGRKSQRTTWHVWNPVKNGIFTCHINWCPTEALVLDVQLCRDLEPVLIFLKEAPLGIHQAGNKGGPPMFPRKTRGFVGIFWSTASLLSCWDVLGGLDDFWKAQRPIRWWSTMAICFLEQRVRIRSLCSRVRLAGKDLSNWLSSNDGQNTVPMATHDMSDMRNIPQIAEGFNHLTWSSGYYPSVLSRTATSVDHLSENWWQCAMSKEKLRATRHRMPQSVLKDQVQGRFRVHSPKNAMFTTMHNFCQLGVRRWIQIYFLGWYSFGAM